MAEELERFKQKRQGHRGVTTRYMKEIKSILSQETIEEDQIHRLGVLLYVATRETADHEGP